MPEQTDIISNVVLVAYYFTLKQQFGDVKHNLRMIGTIFYHFFLSLHQGKEMARFSSSATAS